MPRKRRPPIDPKVEENRRISDERTELLEVIREIVDQEIEARLKGSMQGKFPAS